LQGYPVDVASFLERSGLGHAANAIVEAAKAEHAEALASAALGASVADAHHAGDADLHVDHGTPREVSPPPLSSTLDALHAASMSAQRHHPHGDALFGQEAPLAPRVRDLQGTPCHGALVRLSDAAEIIRLQRNDGFEHDRVIAGWASIWSPRSFDVHAELIRAKPLHGSGPNGADSQSVENSEAFRGRIVLFTRGAIPLLYKVRVAASHGALAAVIIDESDRCADETFGQTCVPGASKALGEGWGAQDPARVWQDAKIPALIVGRAAGRHLLSLASA